MEKEELRAAFGEDVFDGLFQSVDHPFSALSPSGDKAISSDVLKLGMVESYVKGHAECHVTLRPKAAGGRSYKLCFRGVPLMKLGGDGHRAAIVRCAAQAHLGKWRSTGASQRERHAVLMRTRHLLKRLKPPLVSMVRVGFDVPDCFEQLFGNVAAVPSLARPRVGLPVGLRPQGVFKVGLTIPKREVGVPLSFSRQSKDGGGHRLVKRIPNVLDCVGSVPSQIFRDLPDDLYSKLVQSRIAVEIGRSSIGLAFEKFAYESAKIVMVPLGQPDGEVSTFERVFGHDG